MFLFLCWFSCVFAGVHLVGLIGVQPPLDTLRWLFGCSGAPLFQRVGHSCVRPLGSVALSCAQPFHPGYLRRLVISDVRLLGRSGARHLRMSTLIRSAGAFHSAPREIAQLTSISVKLGAPQSALVLSRCVPWQFGSSAASVLDSSHDCTSPQLLRPWHSAALALSDLELCGNSATLALAHTNRCPDTIRRSAPYRPGPWPLWSTVAPIFGHFGT